MSIINKKVKISVNQESNRNQEVQTPKIKVATQKAK